MLRLPSSVAAVLSELVACPSVAPEADSAGTPKGEAAMADLVGGMLRALGADVTTVPLAPGRPNVIGVFEPAGGARATDATVLFAPHLDTVGAAGMTVPPFKLTSRAGRLHGRGACDTKGPTAALLWALREWTHSPARRRSRVRWVVAATAGEEDGSLGAQSLVNGGRIAPSSGSPRPARSKDTLDRRQGQVPAQRTNVAARRESPAGPRLAVDFAIALEPTDLRVVHAGKGILRLWIETQGRTAHGARPELGENAIYRMLPLAAALEREAAPALAARRHPTLGGASLNLGLISGGRGLNVVPDACTIGLDLRLHPHCPSSAARKLIADLCRKNARGAKIRIHCDLPSFVTPRSNPWAQALRKTAARGWTTVPWFSDANIFGAAGIPSVAFGPGSIAQAHTRDEYILKKELAAGAAAFLRFLATPCP